MKTLRKTAEEAYLNMQIKLLIVKHGQVGDKYKDKGANALVD